MRVFGQAKIAGEYSHDLGAAVTKAQSAAECFKAGGGSIEQLLAKALPVWKDTLANGGAVALSFNCLTLKTARVRELMRNAGFEVMEGGAWDGFEHWVEQAVTRDIAVGVKR